MSISSRITEIEQHIGNAYDKIEDLGIDLTDVDKNIDNISTMLENVWNEYPKVSASDVEEASLNGTKKGRMNIDLKGNTEQDGEPTPESPVPIKNVTGQANVKIQNKNLVSINEFTNTSVTSSTIQEFTNFKIGQTITFSAKLDFGSSSKSGRIRFNITHNDGTSETYIGTLVSGTGVQTSTATFTVTDNVDKIFLQYQANNVGIRYYDFQVEYGSTATTYVAHQEQNYPFSLKSKNLFDIENLNFNNGYYDNNGNFISNNNNGAFDFIKVKPNTNYIFSLSSNVYNISIVEFNNLKTFIKRNQLSNVDKNEVLLDSETNYIRITINLNNVPTVTKEKVKALNPQLEEGTTATAYEPYYDIKAMQGTTLQDDGIHQKRKQFVLTEEKINQLYPSLSTFYNIQCISIDKRNLGWKPDWHFGVCLIDRYKEIKNTSTIARGQFATNLQLYYLNIFDDRFTDLATAKELLVGTIIEIEQAEEEIIPYNETQQAQYNAIKKAQGYNDQTNISQTNDELPFILDIKALKNN